VFFPGSRCACEQAENPRRPAESAEFRAESAGDVHG